MTEYIERAAVHELVKSIPHYQMFNYDRTESRRGISPDDVDFGVDKIPAADVAEVRHGRWMTTDAYPHHLYCSVCYKTYAKNAKWVNELDLPTNYCPNCGARMGKEDEHEAD